MTINKYISDIAELIFPSSIALVSNTIVALLTVLYVKSAIFLTDVLVVKNIIRPVTSRKIVHMSAASWIMFWPLFDQSHWSWRLNVTVPVVFSLRLFIKGAIIKDPNDEDVRVMSRSGNPSELLYGPLQFTLIMIWLGLTKFMSEESCIIMGALGYGDGIAPLIGFRFGKHKYRFPFSGVKSFEGSLAVFLGTIFGICVLLHGLSLPKMQVERLLLFGLSSAILEGCAPNYFDNVVIPFGILYISGSF